jgi:hypothetical protein
MNLNNDIAIPMLQWYYCELLSNVVPRCSHYADTAPSLQRNGYKIMGFVLLSVYSDYYLTSSVALFQVTDRIGDFA